MLRTATPRAPLGDQGGCRGNRDCQVAFKILFFLGEEELRETLWDGGNLMVVGVNIVHVQL